jgi:hypothetical protein
LDKLFFQEACERVRTGELLSGGIGTLGEKTLHKVLKYYFEPYEGSQEARLGGFVADIAGEHGVIEIQTRQFDKLRRKLAAFLEVCPVTVVYPVAQTKWLVWIDPETGEATAKRRSPKTGRPWEIFRELYRIKGLLTHPELSFRIMMLDIEEYRRLDGWSGDRKKGSSRHERFPVALRDEVEAGMSAGWDALIPPGLPEEFDVKDFRKASRLSLDASGTAVHVLHHVGALERTGKRGRAFAYRIAGKR